MDVVQVLHHIVFIREADPHNSVRIFIVEEFNELPVNTIQHEAVIEISNGAHEIPLFPQYFGAVFKAGSMEIGFVHG